MGTSSEERLLAVLTRLASRGSGGRFIRGFITKFSETGEIIARRVRNALKTT